MIRKVQAWSLALAGALALAACDAGPARPDSAAASVTPASDPVMAAGVPPAGTATAATAATKLTPATSTRITTPLRAGAGDPGAGRAATGASPGSGLGGHSGLGLTGSFPADDVLAAGEHGTGGLGHLRR